MNNACTHIEPDLIAVADGEAGPAARTAVREHVLTCSPCAGMLAEYESLVGALCAASPLPAQLPEVDLLPGILEALEAENAIEHYDEFAAIQNALFDLGDAQRPVMTVDLLDGVMAAIGLSTEAETGAEEFQSLRALEADLEALGADFAARAPRVDLVQDVLRAVRGEQAPAVNVVPMRTRPKPDVIVASAERSRTKYWAAAAAAVLVGAGLYSQLDTPETATPPVQVASNPGPRSLPAPKQAPLRPALPAGSTVKTLSLDQERVATVPRATKYTGATLQAALNARREAMMGDANALERLGNWALLTEDEARALLAQAEISNEALIGAAQFLTAEDRESVLKAAVAKSPEDPYLRAALAKTYNELDNPAAAREQLAALSKLDPANALSQYMEAELLFSENSHGAAISTLASAGFQPRVDAYSQQSALYREQALIANGLDPGVARFLAATTAGTEGTSEWATMDDMRHDLLEYGKQLEDQGEYASAEEVYASVRQMGVQMEQGATLMNDQLTGLTTQYAAVEALADLYELFQSPQNAQILETTVNGLLSGITDLTTGMLDYTGYLFGLGAEELAEAGTQALLEGDRQD